MKQDLIQDYRKLDFQLAAVADMLNGEEAFEADLFIPDQEYRLAVESQIASAQARLDNLESPDSVSALLKSHFSDYLAAQTSDLQARYENPAIQIGSFRELFEFLDQGQQRRSGQAELMIGKLSRTGYVPGDGLLADCREADLSSGDQRPAGQYRGFYTSARSTQALFA